VARRKAGVEKCGGREREVGGVGWECKGGGMECEVGKARMGGGGRTGAEDEGKKVGERGIEERG